MLHQYAITGLVFFGTVLTIFGVAFVSRDRPVVPNLFYDVARLSLSAERRGPPSHKNRNISSQSLFRYKYEQTKYVFYGNASIFV